MNKYSISFGDSKTAVVPDQIRFSLFTHKGLQLIFQHQVHGNQGLAITQENLSQLSRCLIHDSDYLITNIPRIGLGVLTADCLPIALYDEKHQAIGMVHAGWRGTTGKIVINAINHMNQLYGTKPNELQVHFGPCAYPCCYEVDHKLTKELPEWAKPAAINGHFDLIGCNELLLKEIGILPQKTYKAASECTICNKSYCSHRRNPHDKTRQMSIIRLN